MKVLIANRGEIALRILRACRELGHSVVAVYSSADRDLMHVRLADESVCIGPQQVEKSYLHIPALLSAAAVCNADAIHPGYGFLSENAKFAREVEAAGMTFIGPTADVIAQMGNKIAAKQAMLAAGVPTVPGSDGAVEEIVEARRLADEFGYPVMLKAASGGGGRGMAVVSARDEMDQAFRVTSSEARAAFGDGTLYLEKFLERPRHVEIQVIADGAGDAIHLGTRDCSMQRRHQKVIEEGPAPDVDPAALEQAQDSCVRACKQLGYRGAGTFEFLYQDGAFYFIEMNTRVQVEHPVSELITSIDIVQEQLRIADGGGLSVRQEDVQIRGCAIECRINAEDPETMLPSPGKVELFHPPGGFGVRTDSHLYTGYSVPPYYDSLIAKLITWGETRELALNRMQNALEETIISGIKTNIPMQQRLLSDADFRAANLNIHHLERLLKTGQG